MQEEALKKIIEAGIYAPSADNSQPWSYDIKNNDVLLYIDKQRSGSVSDARFVLSDLAIGAVIENMHIKAASLGLTAKIRLFPDNANPDYCVARISFSVAEKHDVLLAEFISDRHTNRAFPLKGKISNKLRNAIQAEARKIDQCEILWLSDRNKKKLSRQVMHKAETLRFQSQSLHNELFSSIRFEEGWKKTCEEGLPPASLAVEPPMRPFFSRLREWSFIKIFHSIGIAPILGFRVAILPTLLASNMCLLTTKSNERTGIVNAGRALQRAWLKATSEGLAVQPFAAAGVYSLGFLSIEPEHKSRLSKITKLMKSLTGKDYGVIFLRMGWAQNPIVPRTGRRNLDSFRLNKN